MGETGRGSDRLTFSVGAAGLAGALASSSFSLSARLWRSASSSATSWSLAADWISTLPRRGAAKAWAGVAGRIRTSSEALLRITFQSAREASGLAAGSVVQAQSRAAGEQSGQAQGVFHLSSFK